MDYLIFVIILVKNGNLVVKLSSHDDI